MSHPIKHHYLPVFYLKRWTGPPDGKLVAFRKWPQGGTNPQRLHPAGIGWQRSLYTLDEVELSLAQKIETAFMQPVDALASDALALLEEDNGGARWSSRLRQAWVIFLRSLVLRTPIDIDALKKRYVDEWGKAVPELEIEYQRRRSPSDPLTANGFLSSLTRSQLEDHALRLIPGLASNRVIAELLMNMHWFVVDVEAGGIELLTSDRPLWMSPMKLDDAFITLPIGPRKMFWSVKHPKWEDYVRRGLPRDWVQERNKLVLRQATSLAIGRTDHPLPFVRKHLGAETLASIFERMGREEDP